MARITRLCAPQRHKWPSSTCTISCRVGCAWRCSKAAADIKKDIEAVYKAGMEINYLPSMPSAASIYDKPLK